jgi:hypothetical protein
MISRKIGRENEKWLHRVAPPLVKPVTTESLGARDSSERLPSGSRRRESRGGQAHPGDRRFVQALDPECGSFIEGCARCVGVDGKAFRRSSRMSSRKSGSCIDGASLIGVVETVANDASGPGIFRRAFRVWTYRWSGALGGCFLEAIYSGVSGVGGRTRATSNLSTLLSSISTTSNRRPPISK